MGNRLDGKVAIVTGATTGIGRSVLERFASEGAKVVAAARTMSKLEEVQQAVKSAGGECGIASVDLSTDDGAAEVIETAVNEFGGVDILVNNAGVGYSYRAVREHSMDAIADSPLDDWNHVMGINLGAVVHCTRRIIETMRARGGGNIVNVASVLGFRGQPDAHAYTTAKGAIINLTRSVAITYAKENIRCNVVCPGFIETPMVDEYVGMLHSEDYRWQWNPMGRMGKPEEIADGCLYLASDESSYCNGSVLTIDGGMTAKML